MKFTINLQNPIQITGADGSKLGLKKKVKDILSKALEEKEKEEESDVAK